MFPGEDFSAWNIGGGHQPFPQTGGFQSPFADSGQYPAPIGSGYQTGIGTAFPSNGPMCPSGAGYPTVDSSFPLPAPIYQPPGQHLGGAICNSYGASNPSYFENSGNTLGIAPAQPVYNYGGWEHQSNTSSYPASLAFGDNASTGKVVMGQDYKSFPISTHYASTIEINVPSGSQSIISAEQGFVGPKPHEDIFAPTLRPYANFDASEDCQRLRKAMKGLGTDEKTIIDIMGHRSVDQRTQIVLQFKTMYGKDLIKEFKSELSGHLYECVESLCYSPADFDALQLRKAVKGAGTDEDALIEILCSRTNEQIRNVKDAYAKMYPGRDLEKDVSSDTTRHFKRILVSLLQANRDESTTVGRMAARRDAEELYQAGEKKLGTDESKFNMILASKSFAHLRAVFEEYANVSKNDIKKALKSEMSGDLLKSMLAIVRCIKNKQKYFAYKLLKSMKGLGTKDRTLIRIIVSRCEIDLAKIKEEFQREYGKTLESWVSGDTTGDYKKLLLALITG